MRRSRIAAEPAPDTLAATSDEPADGELPEISQADPPSTDHVPRPDDEDYEPSPLGRLTKLRRAEAPPKPTQPMQSIRVDEDQALKEYLDSLGPSGSFRVRITRTTPKTLRAHGRDFPVAGHLETISESIDEEGISERYGGGTYDLTITSRRGGSGPYKYVGHRTVVVAGDPKIERLPTNEAPRAPTSDASGGVVVKEVMSMLRDQVEHSRDAKPSGIDPAVQLLIAQLQEDARNREKQVDALREELRQARTQKLPDDPLRDRLLDSLIGGESARITSMRAAHESELRQLKEFHQSELQRREERHDRTVADLRAQHERDVAMTRNSYERELAAIRSSFETSASATRATGEIQVHTLNAEIKRLERDNEELRKDNRELRDKKDKGLIEQIKDLEVVKEALGVDKEDSSTADKVLAAIPAAVDSIGGLIQSRMSQQAQTQAAQAQSQAQVQAKAAAKPRVVVSPKTGERYIQTGNRLEPVKPKPRLVTTDAGEQIEVPQIAPTVITAIIAQLEAAFGRNEEPAIVAQTGKAQIPPDILAWIRQHHTDQVSGVDLFMTKVAKLPGSSPLATQAGRNWLRRVATALISE